MLIKNILHILRASLPYRKRFGNIRGISFWFSVRRDYTLAKNVLYCVSVPQLVHKLWLRAGTSDLEVFKQVVCSGETDFNLGFIPHFIVDAGANIGLSSVVLASRYPRCKIIALEVDTSNYQLLCRNVSKYQNVIPVRKALWSTDSYVKITNPNAEPWAFRVIEADTGDPDSVIAVSLSTLLAENDETEISLLKIDIEGAELELFRNRPEYWINKLKVLAVELHDRFQPGCSAAFEELLSGRSYKEYAQGEYRVIHFA